jgi:hypothetical protein
MLTVDIRLVDAQDAPDEELSVDTQLGQLAPGPQREIFAIATPQLLEAARVLPEIDFVEQAAIGDVLTVQQPLNELVDRLNSYPALAFQVVTELPL